MIKDPIECACVIHGTAYEWIYVQKLYEMLSHNFTRPIRLHVWTEPDRPVPEHMVRHDLQRWPGIEGDRKGWWYKMQMFDPGCYKGRLLYFDLDVVILHNLDWMLELDPNYFWTVMDFKRHFRGSWQGINSSCMLWNTEHFEYVWRDFASRDIHSVSRQFSGDQDYLDSVIKKKQLRYFDTDLIKSWRWEIKDGGMDFQKRIYKRPGAGSIIPINTHIMVFHGRPKPHEITDPVIQQRWGASTQ